MDSTVLPSTVQSGSVCSTFQAHVSLSLCQGPLCWCLCFLPRPTLPMRPGVYCRSFSVSAVSVPPGRAVQNYFHQLTSCIASFYSTVMSWTARWSRVLSVQPLRLTGLCLLFPAPWSLVFLAQTHLFSAPGVCCRPRVCVQVCCPLSNPCLTSI